jgi:hypothetical protein
VGRESNRPLSEIGRIFRQPGGKRRALAAGQVWTDLLVGLEPFVRLGGPEFATRYQGLRHDSGDPLEWGEKAIAHYQKLGIDI